MEARELPLEVLDMLYSLQSSDVLEAMGVPDRLRRGVLRVSLGDDTTPADVDAFLDAFDEVLATRSACKGGGAPLRNLFGRLEGVDSPSPTTKKS